MADIFDVVVDPTRRELMRILLRRHLDSADALHDGEASVGQLVLQLGLSQPTVSKHLKVLRDSGLVTVRDQGQHRFYRLDVTPLGALQEWLEPFTDELRGPVVEAEPEPAAESESVEVAAPSRVAAPSPAAKRLGEALATGVHGVRSAFSRR